MTADGFMEPSATGVRGQICVKNTGEHPTENLSIVNTVQISSTSQVKYTSSTVDLSEKPVLDPGERFCYPFELGFEPLYEQDARYQATTTITITNHIGRTPGSKNCLGTEPCPFGPEIATDLILPGQQ